MRTYRVLLCAVCFHPPLVASADDAKVRTTALGLPTKLSKLWDDNNEGFAGSTTQMVEAVHSVAAGLMPSLIVLEADEGSDAEKERKQSEIERDAQGIAAGIYYSRHATGWGGTMTRIEASIAYCEYVETRITHAVTRLFGDDETFGIDQWRKDWASAGGSLGQGIDAAEGAPVDDGSDGSPGLTIEEGELRFSPGTSGGTLTDSAGALADHSIRFGARAGQRLVFACINLDFRVETAGANGETEAVTSWVSACDIELPKSKDGAYHIRFREEPGQTRLGSPPQFLVEIR